MFTPTISVEFRKALILEMNANTWAAIMDDNPGEFSKINGSYPEKAALDSAPQHSGCTTEAAGRHPVSVLGTPSHLARHEGERDPRPHPLRDPVPKLR